MNKLPLTADEEKRIESAKDAIKQILKSNDVRSISKNKMYEIRQMIKDIQNKKINQSDARFLLFSIFSQLGKSQGCLDVFGTEVCKQFSDFALNYDDKLGEKKPILEKRAVYANDSDSMGFPKELFQDFYSVELIGEGGFGKVYKAINTKTGEISVIKIIRDIGRDAGRSFIDEVSSWRSLQHENIVKFKGANIFPKPYIEIEYIENGSIEDQLLPFPTKEALLIIMQVLDALEYSHSKNILHLDIKPSNILLTKGMKPKITDWNLSKLKSSQGMGIEFRGGFSIEFAAPEQLEHNIGLIGEWTDIYQVGVTLYYMLSGRLPYSFQETDSIEAFKQKVINNPPEPISNLDQNFMQLNKIINKAMEKIPGNRYRSTRDMNRDIRSILNYVTESSVNIQAEIISNKNEVKTKLVDEKKEEKTPARQENIVINNIMGNANLNSQQDPNNVQKTGKSMLFAGEHLKELLKDEKYSQILDWITRNKDFLKEKNSTLTEQLSQYFVPNLNAMIKFGIPAPDGFRERFEALISSLS